MLLLPFTAVAYNVLVLAATSPDEHLRKASALRRHVNYSVPRVRLELAAPAADKRSFFVNGTSLPLLEQSVQDSYAGRLPLATRNSRALFFWYWPSNSNNSDSVTIWLNGGPGCSSMTGFLSELGTYTFRPGTSAPTINAHAWSIVSDIIFIDQPVGTGFSEGTPDVVNEFDVADDFYEFLQTFYSVFPELLTKKLFIAGESYAGYYIPYIAQRIQHADEAEKAAMPLNLQGILINDGVYSTFVFSQEAPMAEFAAAHAETLGLAPQDVSEIANASRTCGFDDLMSQLVYPPHGPLLVNETALNDDCIQGVLDTVRTARESNPCFNVYRITDTCPTPADPIETYFSRADVQEALHVPGFGKWSSCVNTVFSDGDPSDFTDTLFPDLITSLPRGITLWHGLLDILLLANGTRLTIQNITWGGAQGFQSPIVDQIVLDGQPKGVTHSERGLTYYEIANSGHMIPGDQPDVALEVFKIFLGKESNLQTVSSNSSISAGSSGGNNGTGHANRITVTHSFALLLFALVIF